MTYEKVPYVTMRMLPATLGIAVVPLAYLTLRGLDCRATTALLASLLVIFENALVTQSRFILLDSPLVFFTALTVFLWTGFCNEDKHEPFTDRWWAWLALTGLSIGAVASRKWVGLFTMAAVGLGTIRQLYISWFWKIPAKGMGSRVRSFNIPWAAVGCLCRVSVRHINTQGGYLIPHRSISTEQQVTLYPHIDENNDWRIINTTQDNHPETDWLDYPELVYLENGSRIKLRHISTEKNLHSHDYRPPVSEVDFQNEVSAYGMPGFIGDMNDDWIVEIEKGSKRDSVSGRRVRTLGTQLRLKHALTGCYLFSHKVKLPTWAYEQQEVTCNKNAVKANSLWVIESNHHPNRRRPNHWWLSTASIAGYVAVRGLLILREVSGTVRTFMSPFLAKVVKYDTLCGFLFIGWGLHYLPFFLMGRQLFLHHYLPALYFAILLLCAVFDFLTSTLRPRWRLQIASVLIVLAIWNFSIFSPLIYGTTWTKADCQKAQWLRTWDFSCDSFYDDLTALQYSQYKGAIHATPQESVAVPPPLATVGGEPGGRGAMVIEDHLDDHILNEPPQAEKTSVAAGKAEPGRDIFAPAPQAEIKSEKDAIPPLVEDNEPRTITSVGLASLSEGSSKQDENAPEKAAIKPISPEVILSSPSDGTASARATGMTPADSESAVKAKVQGSMDAELAEVDEVRQELFPDAHE
ncbi:hypothetical protein BC826DRAFT_965650 [Russula brevipes]|nr:hypothetical protein BC826DRAFT_965650 [Russula brevipes]